MKYDNSKIKKQSHLLDEATARKLLKNAEYGIFSLQAEDGGAYGIPVSYVWDGAEAVYIHCAKEGRKINFLKLCNKVSLCAVGKTNVLSSKFTTEYESIILEGKAYTGLSKKERMKALELILDKFSPNDKEVGMKYAARFFDETEIIKMEIGLWSGKAKR